MYATRLDKLLSLQMRWLVTQPPSTFVLIPPEIIDQHPSKPSALLQGKYITRLLNSNLNTLGAYHYGLQSCCRNIQMP